MNRGSLQQAGFAILTAIFILVVLAVLGAAMVTVSTNQQTGSAQDIQGARAYQAARAGLEWALYKVSTGAACPASPTSFQPAATTMSGFTVTVTCGAGSSFGGPTVYSVVATACNQPAAGACPNTASPTALYIERRLSVSF